MLRDLRIDLMIVGILRKMEFERAIWIDANIWKVQCKRASGAALMQSHFPPGQAVNRRLGLVIHDIAANILYDNDRSRHRRRLKITQRHLYASPPRPNATQLGAFLKTGKLGERIVNKTRRICDFPCQREREPQYGLRI